MNNAIEACNKYVERIKDLEGKVVSDQIQIDRLEALLKAGAIEHDKRMCDMGDITTRMQARIDALEARNAALEREFWCDDCGSGRDDRDGHTEDCEKIAQLKAKAEAAEASVVELERNYASLLKENYGGHGAELLVRADAAEARVKELEHYLTVQECVELEKRAEVAEARAKRLEGALRHIASKNHEEPGFMRHAQAVARGALRASLPRSDGTGGGG